MSKSGQQPNKADVGGQRTSKDKSEKSSGKSSTPTSKQPPASPTQTGSQKS